MSADKKFADQLSTKIDHGAQRLNTELSHSQIESLVKLVLLISKWNRVYNLTAVRSIEEMVGKHILDSLSVLRWLPPFNDAADTTEKNNAVADLLDVGSGAGLPVLPLAIVRPDLQFLSVESNGKKTRFQHQAILELGLNNVRVKQERIENTNDYAETIVSRAFAAPDKFIEAVEKNCVAHSQVIIMLGQIGRMPDKLPAQFVVSDLVEVDVPYCESTRHIAVCNR